MLEVTDVESTTSNEVKDNENNGYPPLTVVDDWDAPATTGAAKQGVTQEKTTTTQPGKRKGARAKEANGGGFVVLFDNGKFEELADEIDAAYKKKKNPASRVGQFIEFEAEFSLKQK